MKFDISKFNACEDAQEFYKDFNSFEDAWASCPRGDWMLGIAKQLNVDLKVLTKAKAKCALTVRHLMKDQRSINACEVALKFADGLATRDELNAAADAASAAADAASAADYASDAAAYVADYASDAAAYAAAYVADYASDDAAYAAAYVADYASDAAAYAAAYAAYAADAAAYAAAYAAYAADAADADAYAAAAYAAAYVASDAAAYATARSKNRLEAANICREVLTIVVMEKINS